MNPDVSGPPKTSEYGHKGPAKMLVAAFAGIAFGFLLQKGGVAKFNVLIGQLLLQDFTVVIVMLTAILVGMVGILTLHRFGQVQLHLIPTRLGAQSIGGLIFGAGFALIAYCPGTGAAALGQGSWDILFGMFGLIVGSYLYAEMSGWLGRSVERWGYRERWMLPDLLHLRRGIFVPAFAVALAAILLLLHVLRA